MLHANEGSVTRDEQVVELVYELLDAHCDTMRIAGDLDQDDPAWGAHLDYLRDLQRVGRQALAQLTNTSA